MDADIFLQAVKQALWRCEIERYFSYPGDSLEAVTSHWDISLDEAAVRADLASAGGLKASHGQRRMLLVLATLWNARRAQEIFAEGFEALVPTVMSMDRENREILAELLYSYPGWGD